MPVKPPPPPAPPPLMPEGGSDRLALYLMSCCITVVVALFVWMGIYLRNVDLEIDARDQEMIEQGECLGMPAWVAAHAPGARVTCGGHRRQSVLCDVTGGDLPGVVMLECMGSGCWVQRP